MLDEPEEFFKSVELLSDGKPKELFPLLQYYRTKLPKLSGHDALYTRAFCKADSGPLKRADFALAVKHTFLDRSKPSRETWFLSSTGAITFLLIEYTISTKGFSSSNFVLQCIVFFYFLHFTTLFTQSIAVVHKLEIEAVLFVGFNF